MEIVIAAPPRPKRAYAKSRYTPAIKTVVQAAGEWVQVGLDVPNRPGPQQSRLWRDAKKQDVEVQTMYQDGFIYVRLYPVADRQTEGAK